MFTCFVDFKKAYDNVWREGLLYKLKGFGITGKVFKVIESMYNNSEASIFMNGKVSESFKTSVGVKQGDILRTLLFNIFINDLPKEIEKTTNSAELTLFHTTTNSLFFADDLAILALSKEDLQSKLENLNNYCKKWGLQVNLNKTKVMVFNKSGATIKKYKFKFQNTELESVSQYTYLGFVFIPSGKMHTGIENLVNKAKKAWFGIQKNLVRSKEKTISTYTKMIDSLIKPILLYSCEVWGDILSKKLFENKIEKFHLSMCKQILGIHKRANNVATLSELGRYPFSIDIDVQIFKYFQRFIYVDKERYLYKAFQEECVSDFVDSEGWVTSIKNKLNKYGLTSLWKDITKACKSGELTQNYKNKSETFKLRAKDTYLQTCLFSSNLDKTEHNFRNLITLKQQYRVERYLAVKNFENRSMLSKLRIGCHNLLSETSRWYKTDSLCKQCNLGEIEDEYHFLFSCTKYKEIRQETYQLILQSEGIDMTCINDLHDINNFFQNASFSSLNILGEFANKCFNERDKICERFHYVFIF